MKLLLQEMIFALDRFWSNKGCVIHQPHDIEMGAGTYHPATFFGCLGKKPGKVAFVQPSRRPTDGRYGDNPNRLQRFMQYQVIIKPSPIDAQEIYLDSLKSLGLNPLAHDIRFIEDNWESPTLGAWGIGWEVWLDGMEITQFTYFQQVAGIDLAPISLEITYGIERIVMYLQGVESVYDLMWNEDTPYRDLYWENERQSSIYNFEQADTQMWFRLFDMHQKECHRLIEQALYLPAYEHLIHCAHDFNMLDARNAIGVSQRQQYIGSIRAMAKGCAHAFLQKSDVVGQIGKDALTKKTQEE